MAFRRISEIVEEIRREIRRLLEDIERDLELNRPMWDYKSKSLEPLCTIEESENEVIVTFDLPMVDKNNIKINATEDTVEIEAQLKEGFKVEGPRYLGEELRFTCFRKVLRLPSKVDPMKARASFRGGILEIRLPKKVKGYRIKIE